MTQARLRKETGAAYTLKELSDTMQLAPSSSDDSDGQLQRVKLDSLKDGGYIKTKTDENGEEELIKLDD